jgi:protein tyrosine phosphatase (PTP) superfamily phosphohydrolase (DUF442 family)
MQTILTDKLLRSHRPGYHLGKTEPVPEPVVVEWMASARNQGVASIICLLDEQHLKLYRDCAGGQGLVQAYTAAGFTVAHIPVKDHCSPPVNAEQMQRILDAYEMLPKPVLVHCSAGVDRTGAVVRHVVALEEKR